MLQMWEFKMKINGFMLRRKMGLLKFGISEIKDSQEFIKLILNHQ